jgi:hypothetical protein
MSSEVQIYPRWRKLLFRAGLFAGALSLAGGIGCWMNPFPLLPWGEGGYRTNPLDEYLLSASISASLATVFLALFGRGLRRILLIAAGLLLLALSWFGFMSNHV